MLFPLVVLAILSVIGGWVGIPAAMGGHNEIEHFLDPVFANSAKEVAVTTGSGGLELILSAVSVLTAFVGIFVAYAFYYKKPGTASALARTRPRTLPPGPQQVLHRRDLQCPYRHTAVDVHSSCPWRSRRRGPRQWLRRSGQRNYPRLQLPGPPGSVRQHSLLRRLACPRSSCRSSRHDLRPLHLDALKKPASRSAVLLLHQKETMNPR